MKFDCRVTVLTIVATAGGPLFGQAFSDQTLAEGVAFRHVAPNSDRAVPIGAGGAFGDYDGDGWLDLYVANRVGANALFHNLGAGLGFADVAVASGSTCRSRTRPARCSATTTTMAMPIST